MDVRVEFPLTFLAGVGLAGLGAIVKIFADMRSIRKLTLEIEALRAAASTRESRIVQATPEEAYTAVLRMQRFREAVTRAKDAAGSDLKSRLGWHDVYLILSRVGRHRMYLLLSLMGIVSAVAITWILCHIR